MVATISNAPPPLGQAGTPRNAAVLNRSPLTRRDGLSKTQMRAVIAAIAAIHVGGVWGVLQIPAVRQVVSEAAPLFVDFIQPALPPKPEPPPPPPPPRPVPKAPTPPPAVLAAAPTPAPAPYVVPPPPPAPVPAPEPPAPPAPEPPPPAPPAPVRTLSAEAIRYLVEPPLEYPRASQRLREAGTTTVRVLISAEGLPRDVQVSKSSGFSRLDEAAVAAVRKARFKPYVENGLPMPAFAYIPLVFQE